MAVPPGKGDKIRRAVLLQEKPPEEKSPSKKDKEKLGPWIIGGSRRGLKSVQYN